MFRCMTSAKQIVYEYVCFNIRRSLFFFLSVSFVASSKCEKEREFYLISIRFFFTSHNATFHCSKHGNLIISFIKYLHYEGVGVNDNINADTNIHTHVFKIVFSSFRIESLVTANPPLPFPTNT